MIILLISSIFFNVLTPKKTDWKDSNANDESPLDHQKIRNIKFSKISLLEDEIKNILSECEFNDIAGTNDYLIDNSDNINISECKFTNCYAKLGLMNGHPDAEMLIQYSEFQKCYNPDPSSFILIRSQSQMTDLNSNIFTFTNGQGSRCIQLETNGKPMNARIIGNTFQNTNFPGDVTDLCGAINADFSANANNDNSLTISDCIFDGCLGDAFSCFSLTISGKIELKNISMTNLYEPQNGFYCKIKFISDKQDLEIEELHFYNYWSATASNGGYIGLLLQNVGTLTYRSCAFDLRDGYFRPPTTVHDTQSSDKSDVENIRFDSCNTSDVDPYDSQGFLLPDFSGFGIVTSDNLKSVSFTNCNWFDIQKMGSKLGLGSDNNQGAAVYASQASRLANIELTFSQCTFTNCTAQKTGGALYIETNNLVTIEYCTFKDLSLELPQGGRAIFIKSLSQQQKIVIDNCDFPDNPNGNHNIYLEGEESGEFIISNCRFPIIDSSTGYEIYVGQVKRFECINTEFIGSQNNQISAIDIKTNNGIDGGIINSTFRNMKGDPTNLDSRFDTRIINYDTQSSLFSTQLFTIDNCTFENCETRAFKFFCHHPIAISNTNFSNLNNDCFSVSLEASSDQGSSSLNEITVSSCRFTSIEISSEYSNGGFYISKKIPDENYQELIVKFEGCVWEEITGGQQYLIDSSENSKRKLNQYQFENCDFTNIEVGSSIFSFSQSTSLTSCNFWQNTQLNSIIIFKGLIENVEFSLSKCNFRENQVTKTILDISNVDKLKLNECSFENTVSGTNEATDAFVCDFLSGSQLIIQSCSFTAKTSPIQNPCFIITNSPDDFQFEDSIIENYDMNNNNYIATIESASASILTMTNLTFQRNKCNGLYQGGSGIRLTGFSALVF